MTIRTILVGSLWGLNRGSVHQDYGSLQSPPSDTLLINISKITEDNSAGKTNTNTAQQSQKLESCRFFISTSFYICKEVNPPKNNRGI